MPLEPMDSLNVRFGDEISHAVSYSNYNTDDKIRQTVVQMSKDMCETRHNSLQMSLAIVATNPGMTHLLGYGAGFVANKKGSILQLGQCTDVSEDVEIRDLEGNVCFENVAIWTKNRTLAQYRDSLGFYIIDESETR